MHRISPLFVAYVSQTCSDRDQNAYLAESWKKRESGVKAWKTRGPVILPALLSIDLSLGSPREGVLSTLKISARNCRFCSRNTLKFLKMDMSDMNSPGPVNWLRRTVPNCAIPVAVNGPVCVTKSGTVGSEGLGQSALCVVGLTYGLSQRDVVSGVK